MDDDLKARAIEVTIRGMDRSRSSPVMTAGQRALAEALGRGENHVGDEVRELGTHRYIDPARFARERALFRTSPTALCPSALVGTNHLVRHRDTGLDVLVTRDGDGAIHVLANSCAHRATRLIDDDEPHSSRKIVCPYHAWTYRADGSLLAYPRKDAFPGLCKEEQALTRYPASEAGGIVWFIGDPDATEDFADVELLGPDMHALGLGDARLFARNIHDVAANWKMVVDAFCESYHVQRLHAGSIAPFFADGVAVCDRMGPHQRFIVGRADHARKVDLDDWAAVREVMTFTYQIFPNAVVVVSPDYVNLLVIHPQDAGRCRVENFMLIPGDADPALERWQKSWDLLDRQTFGGEDFVAAALCQRGVEAGLRETMTLGTLEHNVAIFHDILDARLSAQSI